MDQIHSPHVEAEISCIKNNIKEKYYVTRIYEIVNDCIKKEILSNEDQKLLRQVLCPEICDVIKLPENIKNHMEKLLSKDDLLIIKECINDWRSEMIVHISKTLRILEGIASEAEDLHDEINQILEREPTVKRFWSLFETEEKRKAMIKAEKKFREQQARLAEQKIYIGEDIYKDPATTEEKEQIIQKAAVFFQTHKIRINLEEIILQDLLLALLQNSSKQLCGMVSDIKLIAAIVNSHKKHLQFMETDDKAKHQRQFSSQSEMLENPRLKILADPEIKQMFFKWLQKKSPEDPRLEKGIEGIDIHLFGFYHDLTNFKKESKEYREWDRKRKEKPYGLEK